MENDINAFARDVPISAQKTRLVVDLVRGHMKALQYLEKHPGVHTHNLGTGRGYSVLEIIKAFESASGQSIPYEVVERRPGDAAVSFTDPAKARRELDWHVRWANYRNGPLRPDVGGLLPISAASFKSAPAS